MKRSTNNKKQRSTNFLYVTIWGRSVHLFHIVLMAFIIATIGYVAKGTIETAIIANNGIKTNGVITEIVKSGSKGVEDYYYVFSYNSVDYTNSTIHLTKNIGDTVVVIFLEDNPSKNKLEESLLKTYGFFLKRNVNLNKASICVSKMK